MGNRLAVLVGAGSGVGAALARRLGGVGYDVALVARSRERLNRLVVELAETGVRAVAAAVDVTEPDALAAAVGSFGHHAGRVDLLHFNPSTFRHRDPLHLSVAELLEDVHLGAGALLTAVQAARPYMSRGARVTATGSMAADRPWHEACSLGVQKAALRNLVLSLDATLAPDGIRAVCLTVNGTLAEDGPFSPDRVAGAILAAAQAPEEDWRAEVPYDG